MSAYVVKNKVINRILSGLNHTYGWHGLWCLEYDFLKALRGAQGDGEARESLGRELYAINCESVRYRYGDSDFDNLPGSIDPATGKSPAPYEYRLIGAPSLVQLYEDIKCWIYQSCESEVCQNDPVYKAIECFKARVADTIISGLPEYEKAGWDS